MVLIRTSQLVEAKVPPLLAEARAITGEVVEAVVICPERIGGVAFHIIPFLEMIQIGRDRSDRSGRLILCREQNLGRG